MTAQFHAGEIQEPEVDRFLDFEGILAAEYDPGNMGFAQHAGLGVIARGYRQK